MKIGSADPGRNQVASGNSLQTLGVGVGVVENLADLGSATPRTLPGP